MPPKSKKNALDAKKAIKTTSSEEPIIVQLPIPQTRIDEIIRGDDMSHLFEYNPTIKDPEPYQPTDVFNTEYEGLQIEIANSETKTTTKVVPEKIESVHTSQHTCFWCCHPAESISIGMPMNYNGEHHHFTTFGNFCSLECAAAYNFSVHMGMEKAWDIHSLIQLMARHMNYPTPIRPAPSRYILKMFGGPYTIEEFRQAHRGTDKTYLLNIPPLVSVQSQFEVLNTSFITSCETKAKSSGFTEVKTKPLDSKLNITFTKS
jgi:hypothetical protein